MTGNIGNRIKNCFDKVFLSHPREIGESYFAHFFTAFKFGFMLLIAGGACIIHSIFPLVFKHTASNIVKRTYENMMKRVV